MSTKAPETNEPEYCNQEMEQRKSFETILNVIGPNGKWQYLIVTVLFLHEVLTAAGIYIFLLGIPNYNCTVPELEAANWTLQQIQDLSIPDKLNQCEIYNLNYTALTNLNNTVLNQTNFTRESVIPCTTWRYTSNEFFGWTAVAEWDLICSNEALRPTIQSVYMFGVLFGSITAGILSNIYGRFNTLLWLTLVLAIGGTGSVFVPWYSMYLLCRFMEGFGGLGSYGVMYSLVQEILLPEMRAKWVCLSSCAAGVVLLLYTGFAYVIKNWRYFTLTVAVPRLFLPIIIWCFISESPRWLLTKGRLEEAEHVLIKACKMNGRTSIKKRTFKKLIKDVYHEISSDEKRQEEKTLPASNQSVIKKWIIHFTRNIFIPNYRLKFLATGYLWLVTSAVWYGTGYAASKLEIGPYVSDTFNNLIKVIAALLTPVSVDIFGRKPVISLSFLLAGAFAIATGFAPKSIPVLSFVFLQIVTLFTGILFNGVFLVTAEIFPTQIRTMVVCFGSACARIGAIASPYVVDLLAHPITYLPSVLFGGISILAGCVTMCLPETNRKNLLDTLSKSDVQMNEDKKKNKTMET